MSNKNQPIPTNGRTPGGLIIPAGAGEIVKITPRKYAIGGIECHVPEDPKVVLQMNPGVLQDQTQMLGFMSALLNQTNCLVREVNRLREAAGLPEWTGDKGLDPDAKEPDDDDQPADDEPSEATA